MAPRKPNRKQMMASCDEIGPEDGLDPRFDRPEGTSRRPGRKSLQLCRAAQRTLEAVLLGECHDDVLRDLTVLCVVPAGGGRLAVTVALAPSAQAVAASEVRARLNAVMPQLRREVAAAVERRRAPELVFELATLPRADD